MWFPGRRKSAAPGEMDQLGIGPEPYALGGRACCCAAQPVVRVMLAGTPDRPPVDLLLCCHHYRASRAVLASVGALVFDRTGALVGHPAPSTTDRPTPPPLLRPHPELTESGRRRQEGSHEGECR